MKLSATTKSAKISPRKVRLVAAVIRNQNVSDALRKLALAEKRAAGVLEKTLKSAVANALHNAKIASEMLVVQEVQVSDGPAMKRFRPSTRGRTHPYKKRMSHITITLAERGGK